MSDDLTSARATVPADVPESLPDLDDTPSSEAPQYYCLLTNAGAALEAVAHAAGKPVRLTHVAVGDGKGAVPEPTVGVTALVNEVYRRPIDSLSQDEDDPNIAWIHIVIPADVGGFWIREFAVLAEPLEDGGDPVLYAYGNHAPYYKLKRVLGQATTHELSIPLILSATAEVEIVIAEAGYASRLELLHLSGIVEALRHPQDAVWTLDKAVPAGGALALPDGVTYAPGRNLVDLSWDGLTCHPAQQYEEIIVSGAAESTSLKLLFDAPEGSEFRVLVRGYSLQPRLPEGNLPQGLEARVDALEETVAKVADGAVYVTPPAG